MQLVQKRKPEEGLIGRFLCTPEEWYRDYPDNPFQRDTESHAKLAKRRGYLDKPLPQHRLVDLGRLPSGDQYKLNGHTRGLLWHRQEIPSPGTVEVSVWSVPDYDGLREQYRSYDSTNAAKSAGDDLFGAIRESGVEFQSDYLKARKFSAAIRAAYEQCFDQTTARRADASELLKFWLPELRLLDGCKPTYRNFITPVTVGALVTFRRYGPDIEEFWSGFAADAGTKMDGERDAIQTYADRVKDMRAASDGLGSRRGVFQILSLTISAVEAHRSGHWYKAGAGMKTPKPTTVRKFIHSALQRRRTW